MTTFRSIGTVNEEINKTLDDILGLYPRAILIGEGVPDPKAIFGTTKGLKEKYPGRVFDSPVSEAGVTGVCIGAALNGMRPIHTHQRIDFSLYAADQLINNAAKWYSMFGGQKAVPMVVRMVIGRGWGQGNQHSQNLSALYAHIPGLKVFMPSGPISARNLLCEAFHDQNPVLFLEHKWLQNCRDDIKEKEVENARILIVSWGFAAHECKKAIHFLEDLGVPALQLTIEVLNPLKIECLKQLTGPVLIVDDAWAQCGIAAEVMAQIHEQSPTTRLKRLTYPNFPSPSSPELAKHYYNGPKEIMKKVAEMLDIKLDYTKVDKYMKNRIHDVDPFTGKVTSAI